ncbi:MAG: hypothetical protein SGPRY_002454 [Prymnesium sp.]
MLLSTGPKTMLARAKEIRALALSLARSLPGRAGLKEGALLRGLPDAMDELKSEETWGRASAEVHNPPPVDVGPPPSSTRSASLLTTAPPHSSTPYGPPAFVAAELKRARLQQKMEAAKSRLGLAGPSPDPNLNPHPNPSTNLNPNPNASLSQDQLDTGDGHGVVNDLDQEAHAIEEALARGVSETAIMQGNFCCAEKASRIPMREHSETLSESDLGTDAPERLIKNYDGTSAEDQRSRGLMAASNAFDRPMNVNAGDFRATSHHTGMVWEGLGDVSEDEADGAHDSQISQTHAEEAVCCDEECESEDIRHCGHTSKRQKI